MTKPQTDLEEVKDLIGVVNEHRSVIDGRPNVGTPNEFVALTPDQERARKRRNVMLALSVAAFMVLVFLITVSRVGGAIMERSL